MPLNKSKLKKPLGFILCLLIVLLIMENTLAVITKNELKTQFLTNLDFENAKFVDTSKSLKNFFNDQRFSLKVWNN